MNQMRCALGIFVLALAQSAASQPVTASLSCADLARLPAKSLGDETASIESAQMVEAGPGPADPRPGAPPAPLLPRHCELFGKLQEHAGANGQSYAIRFHLRLPAMWNERFFFHGGGGPATDQADFFSALVNWTEHGTAPESFVATAGPGTNWPGRTRLLCTYPRIGRYVGGDVEQASSFACR
jgi:hypothetical protein